MSEDRRTGPGIVQRWSSPLAFAIVLAGPAMWQDRLTTGTALFVGMTAIWMVARTLITGGARLPVASSVGGRRDAVLIRLVGIGMMALPILAIATPFLDAARYE